MSDKIYNGLGEEVAKEDMVDGETYFNEDGEVIERVIKEQPIANPPVEESKPAVMTLEECSAHIKELQAQMKVLENRIARLRANKYAS